MIFLSAIFRLKAETHRICTKHIFDPTFAVKYRAKVDNHYNCRLRQTRATVFIQRSCGINKNDSLKGKSKTLNSREIVAAIDLTLWLIDKRLSSNKKTIVLPLYAKIEKQFCNYALPIVLLLT